MLEQSECSFSGDLLELSLSVGESDVEFFCAGNNSRSLGGWDALSDFTAVSSVVHEQQFHVFLVSDQKLSKTAWKHVTSSLGLLLTNLWHFAPTTVATALRVVDTSRSSPWVLNTHKLAIRNAMILPFCSVGSKSWESRTGGRIELHWLTWILMNWWAWKRWGCVVTFLIILILFKGWTAII